MAKSNIDRLYIHGERGMAVGNHSFRVSAPAGYRVVSSSIGPSLDDDYAKFQLGTQFFKDDASPYVDGVIFSSHTSALGSVAWVVICEPVGNGANPDLDMTAPTVDET